MSSEDNGFLYRLELSQPARHASSQRGRTRPPADYLETLQRMAFSPMICVDVEQAEPFGLITGYDTQLATGTMWLAATVTFATRRTGLPMIAMALYIDHCFEALRLRRLFFEAQDHSLDLFRSAVRYFDGHHGRYILHERRDGAFVDRSIHSLSRDFWYEAVRPWLSRSGRLAPAQANG